MMRTSTSQPKLQSYNVSTISLYLPRHVDRMSQIESYAPNHVYIVPAEGDAPRSTIKPGDLVRHLNCPGIIGVVVMRAGDEMTILWSKSPDRSVGIFDPNDFTTKKGVMSDYASSKIRHDYFGTVTIKPEDTK